MEPRLSSQPDALQDDYSYSYNTVGNLTEAVTPAATTSYTHDLADRITSGAVPPTYDDNGNITNDGSYGGRAYSYDALGRLTGVSGTGLAATYSLDGAGNRWAETVDGVTTAFDLDLSAANPTILHDGSRTYLPGAPGAGYEQGGVWWSALTDLVGSPLQHVSQTGTTSTAVHYDPYGTPRVGSADPGGIGYAGEWKNATGLVNLRFRAYDPALGRFVGRDTFGGVASAPQTGNRYSYALNNPFRYTDPSGHFVSNVIDYSKTPDGRSMLFGSIPFIGDAYSLVSGAVGFDPLAGRSLGTFERGLSLAAALPFVPGLTGIVGRAGDDLAGLAVRNADELAGARGLTRAGDHYGMGPTRYIDEFGGGGGAISRAGGDLAGATARSGKPASQASRVRARSQELEHSVRSAIESAHSGHVRATNFEFGSSGTRAAGEVDILLGNAIVEVTGGTGRGKGGQVTKLISQFELPVIVYGPDLGKHAIREIERRGGLATRSLAELVDLVRP